MRKTDKTGCIVIITMCVAFPKTEELKITGGALEGVMPKGVIHDLWVL